MCVSPTMMVRSQSYWGKQAMIGSLRDQGVAAYESRELSMPTVRRALVFALLAMALLGIGCTVQEQPPDSLPPEIKPPSGTAAPVEEGISGENGANNAAPVAFRLSELDATLLTGNFERCPDCHSLLDAGIRGRDAIVPSFSHGFHLEQGAACADCHSVPTHTSDGTRRPPMDKCFDCHSQEDTSAPSGECSACHPDGFSLEPASHAEQDWLPVRDFMDAVQGEHTKASENDQECRFCHGPTFCRDCHKMDMPHPSKWQENHAQTAQKVGGSACTFCHPDREACKACHHAGYEAGGAPWTEVHPTTAQNEGVEKCVGCHSTKTCAHCHVTGEYKEYD